MAAAAYPGGSKARSMAAWAASRSASPRKRPAGSSDASPGASADKRLTLTAYGAGNVSRVAQATVAMARAATPSPRPMKPILSAVVNFTFTAPTGSSTAEASEARMSSR